MMAGWWWRPAYLWLYGGFCDHLLRAGVRGGVTYHWRAKHCGQVRGWHTTLHSLRHSTTQIYTIIKKNKLCTRCTALIPSSHGRGRPTNKMAHKSLYYFSITALNQLWAKQLHNVYKKKKAVPNPFISHWSSTLKHKLPILVSQEIDRGGKKSQTVLQKTSHRDNNL